MSNQRLSQVFLLLITCLLFCCNKTLTEEMPKIKRLNSLGEFKIKVKEDKLILAPNHGEIRAPLLYTDDFSNFNFNGFYRISNKLGDTSYFRFGWVSYKDSSTQLSNIKWYYKDIPITQGFETFTIETISVPKEHQEGDIKICTIGDSQTWWGNASALRKNMHDLAPEFSFTGSNTDIYNFQHEGEGGNSTQQVINRIEKTPYADYYTLLIGTNDWKKDIEEVTQNIIYIITFLNEKYPSAKVIYVDPLPTVNSERESFNKNLSKKVQSRIGNKQQVLFCPLGTEMRLNKNWEKDYLTNDGLHPNTIGVQFMAEKITTFIQSNLH